MPVITIPPIMPALPNRAVAFFFDIDGTLAPLASTPDEAEIPLETMEILCRLHHITCSSVAFISGRNIDSIDALTRKHFAASGQHGLEWRDAMGNTHRQNNDVGLFATLNAELEILRNEHPELIVENKGLSIALHYRRAPWLESLVIETLHTLAKNHEGKLTLKFGKMVGELLSANTNKGDAVRQLMRTQEFKDKQPIFIGDDITDEDGFTAVNAVGGISIKIGQGETQAHCRLDNCEALVTWLRRVALHLAPNPLQAGQA